MVTKLTQRAAVGSSRTVGVFWRRTPLRRKPLHGDRRPVRFRESVHVFTRYGFPVPVHVPALGVCFAASVLYPFNWSMAPCCPDSSALFAVVVAANAVCDEGLVTMIAATCKSAERSVRERCWMGAGPGIS